MPNVINSLFFCKEIICMFAADKKKTSKINISLRSIKRNICITKIWQMYYILIIVRSLSIYFAAGTTPEQCRDRFIYFM